MQRIIADLHVQNPADKEAQLALALGTAIKAAKAEKACGVLVTRHHYAKFTVALSPAVPYGQTHELDLAPSYRRSTGIQQPEKRARRREFLQD